VLIHSMAGNPNRRPKAPVIINRFRIGPRSIKLLGPSISMVGSVLGTHRMLQQQRKVQLCHRRLRLRPSHVQRRWCNPTRNFGRNYDCTERRARFLRREQRGRVQRSDVRNPKRWQWRLQKLELPEGHQRCVPWRPSTERV